MFLCIRQAVLLSAAFCLAACTNLPQFDGTAALQAWANQQQFKLLALNAPPFRLMALHRPASSPNDTLTIYIEGDGAAWPRPHLPPSDPTPKTPLALLLAAKDKGAVLYLGRPCQFLSADQLAKCPQQWWTHKRFSAEVIAAYQLALNEIKEKTGYRQFRLVGYSGGGVIAALLADHRQDVSHLTTIASPLSLGNWTAWHKVSPLQQALDPITLKSPSRIPALHYVGARDDVVPEAIVQAYVSIRGGTLLRVEDADHDCCWLDLWQRNARRTP